MEFRILGPLEVVDGERSISLGGPKQRSVLALLLLARGRAVSTDTLVERIWDGRPPETARKSVQGYVGSLREALGGRIETVERGYALPTREAELDVEVFEDLARTRGGESARHAATRLDRALALVRGHPLEDLRHERWAETEASRLDEVVLSAQEACNDAELSVGHDARLVPELERLSAAHPYRERFAEQLMLALYRSGRQAAALEAYRRVAHRLRTDLGLEPGRALQELEQRMLNHDPALEPRNRLEQARRRRRFGWKLIAFGGALIALAAVAAGVLVERSRGASLESVKPSVIILDTQTGKVVARWPYQEFAYPWATTGDGRFWLASTTSGFTEIDARTGRFVRRVLPPFATGTNLALPSGNSIWFTGVGGLARYDMQQGRETARYRLMRGTHRFGLYGITRASRSIWVASVEENEVIRVDPSTGAAEARIPVRSPWVLASGEGGIWVTSETDGVERIDPATNTVAAVAAVPQPLDSVVVGGGFAWVTNDPKGAVYQVDSTGHIVQTYFTGDGAHEPSFSDGKVWVSNESGGTLTSIDATTGALRDYRFGHPLGTEAALGRYVMVAITGGLTVDQQLARLNGRIAKLIVPVFQFDPPDPPLVSNPFVLQLERATCAGLLSYPARGGPPQPELASSLPAVSDDGRTYTFTVRRGVRFAPPSRAVVTAQAVRYSIERALSPKLGTPRPASVYLEDLTGYEAYGRGTQRHISGIRVEGDRISFTLRARSADFLERLSLPYFCTVPLGTPIVDGGLQPVAPPSAGPYYMASRENGAWTLLRANPNYRGRRTPKLDAIVLREGLDSGIAVGRVERGDWDALALDDSLLEPDGSIARRFAVHNRAKLMYRALPEARLDFIALNAGRGPLRDPTLRRSVAVALDAAGLAESRSLTPTVGLLPPAVRGGGIVGPSRRLRRQSGGRHDTLTLVVDQECGEACSRFAAIVAAALRPLGLTVRTQLSANVAASMRAPHGRVDMAALETSLPYPDPASFLERMLGHEVPRAWLPASTRSALDLLDGLTGARRDAAAISLARRFAKVDAPVVAYGTPEIGALLSSRLGCVHWDHFDSELDLSALCLRRT